jgi:RNA polymerase sigma factor (sigma-70 family)
VNAGTPVKANDDVVALLPVLRRVAEARGSDPSTADDVVQETVTRVIEVRDRLTPSALTSYAVVTLRNLILSLEREKEVRDRHAHRLVDLQEPERPDDVALREEERKAVATALSRLPLRDREALIAHEVTGTTTVGLAQQLRSTPGAVAVRLARARARMRLEYVMALRQVDLPTRHCRSVLLALSSGDKRRQVATDSGGHLLNCSTCASLSEPLLRRRHGLAALLPFHLMGKEVARYVRAHQTQAVTIGGAGVATAAIVSGIILSNGSPSTQGPFLVQNQRVRASAIATTDEYAGHRVSARGVRVLSVPSDEGFWIGSGQRDRVWVLLRASGESSFTVRSGRRVVFTGRIVAHGPRFPDQVGVEPGEGRAALVRQSQHIEVTASELRLK